MKLALALAAFAWFLSGCSSTSKTRLDCYQECKTKGLKWSGVVSRSERIDDQGLVEASEVCRCNIEESL
jgi:hypothetical protein